MKPASQLHRLVGEPMHLLQGEPAAVEAAQHDAAALGPQVRCRQIQRRPPAHRTYAPATPPSTVRVHPVVRDERLEAKKSTASATSSGRTLTFKAVRWR